MICTCGGTMSGNWATGSAYMAITPASVMTIEMTSDRRGRSMKVEDSIAGAPTQPRARSTPWRGPNRRQPVNGMGKDP